MGYCENSIIYTAWEKIFPGTSNSSINVYKDVADTVEPTQIFLNSFDHFRAFLFFFSLALLPMTLTYDCPLEVCLRAVGAEIPGSLHRPGLGLCSD